ncbi:hypothetical protein [Streptomyces tsukubensis]|uniref:Uncharacterized protein n=1 Tax=Streptomyces tsukubensis TaxID=83656 RepID=A0A1V4AAH4_9ACTN|nr:hypothetical protein [Streptomyces tsukubensis]OON79690.1 hypothetical protein B1H18_14095 [Streptomyces tsukubensis]QFR95880.1 hypothetical protein GBW32_26120 [Streptomyces tsukubensis]
MESKTVDETGPKSGTDEAVAADGKPATEGAADKNAEGVKGAPVDKVRDENQAGRAAPDEVAADEAALGDDDLDEPVAEGRKSSGVGLGAGAIVSAALGFVSLSGGWVGTVASARSALNGQLKTAQSASVPTQLKALYGDSWHATAMFAGAFALVALIVGVVVLVRPAFGAPGKVTSAPWIKSVAWGGVVLGVIGLLLAVAKVTDIILGLPSSS